MSIILWCHAIRKILSGQLCFEPAVTKLVLNSADPNKRNGRDGHCNLTQRQREVLRMVAEGRVSKEIAGVVRISVRTVEFHKYRIMDTLGLRTIPELAVYAVRTGIVP